MPVFDSYFHPCHDLGGRTNYRLPPRWARRLISATLCSFKGHAFTGYGTADGSWDFDASFKVCKRCAVRRFYGVASHADFVALMETERKRMKKALAEDRQTV